MPSKVGADARVSLYYKLETPAAMVSSPFFGISDPIVLHFPLCLRFALSASLYSILQFFIPISVLILSSYYCPTASESYFSAMCCHHIVIIFFGHLPHLPSLTDQHLHTNTQIYNSLICSTALVKTAHDIDNRSNYWQKRPASRMLLSSSFHRLKCLP